MAVINEGSTNIEPNTGDTIPLDSTVKIQVLHANKYASDNNDASLVLKLTYGNVSFMLMGDASKEIETQIASKYNVSAQILKAGHHGSNTSSGLSFMQKVNPKAVILSYGEDNSYGHPHSEVLANIKKIGATAYGTAVSGSVIVTTDSVTYSVNAKPMSNTSKHQQRHQRHQHHQHHHQRETHHQVIMSFLVHQHHSKTVQQCVNTIQMG